jgi:hypothetical protein
MSELLDSIAEPQRLFLAWQSSDLHGANRYRYAVGVIERTPETTFRYFEPGSEFEQHNQGRSFSEVEALGYTGYPAFDRSRLVHSSGVMDALMRRLPPRSRKDFAEYAARFLLPADKDFSDMALLGRTEATLPSDGFSVVDPLNPETTRCDLLLEVAGYRYYAAELAIAAGQAIEVVADRSNAHDPNAVEFRVGGLKFGNVNRLQAQTFRRWLEEAHVEGRIERINGTPERPRAFVFVRVRPKQDRLAA